MEDLEIPKVKWRSPSFMAHLAREKGFESTAVRPVLLCGCGQEMPRVSRMGNRRFGSETRGVGRCWCKKVLLSRREIPYFAGRVLYLDCTALRTLK